MRIVGHIQNVWRDHMWRKVFPLIHHKGRHILLLYCAHARRREIVAAIEPNEQGSFWMASILAVLNK